MEKVKVKEKTFLERVSLLQSELKAPKNMYNNFGDFNYRNLESILEAVKPLLIKYKMSLFIEDDILPSNERFYLRATAKLVDWVTKESISSKAFAREQDTKKGMDSAQITGASSSYARKYALNSLLLIDDVQDPDAQGAEKKVSREELVTKLMKVQQAVTKLGIDRKEPDIEVWILKEAGLATQDLNELNDEQVGKLIKAYTKMYKIKKAQEKG